MNLDRRICNVEDELKELEAGASAAFERVFAHLTEDEFDLAAAYKKKPVEEQESPTNDEKALGIRLWDLMTLSEKLVLCALCGQGLDETESAYGEWRQIVASEEAKV